MHFESPKEDNLLTKDKTGSPKCYSFRNSTVLMNICNMYNTIYSKRSHFLNESIPLRVNGQTRISNHYYKFFKRAVNTSTIVKRSAYLHTYVRHTAELQTLYTTLLTPNHLTQTLVDMKAAIDPSTSLVFLIALIT